MDEEYDSPFMQEARRNGFDVEGWEKAQGKMLVGGKMDDIAVVVVFLDVEENCPCPPPLPSLPGTGGTDMTDGGEGGEPRS